MHHHVASKGNCQVVSKPFLTSFGCKPQRIFLCQFLRTEVCQHVAGVEHLEEQAVSLLSVLAHQRGEHLHRRSFYLVESEEFVHLAYGVEYVVAPAHFDRTEIAHSFGYRRLLHYVCISW